MLSDTNVLEFLYIRTMSQTKNAAPAQGARPAPLSKEQIKAALERDFSALHNLLSMVRTEPRILDDIANILWEKTQNIQTVNEAKQALAENGRG